jgi:hypothetical protein
VNPGARSGNGVSEASSSSLSIEAQLAFSMPWPIHGRSAFAGPVAKTPADDPSSAYVADFLATSEGLALVKAFVCIEDPKLRRAIVRLVEEIVPETGSSNED